jgi:hypothetical protein
MFILNELSLLLQGFRCHGGPERDSVSKRTSHPAVSADSWMRWDFDHPQPEQPSF